MISHPTARRQSLIFPFLILPFFMALVIYASLQSQWMLAGAIAILWVLILVFCISYLAQALVALVMSVGLAAEHLWLAALIAAFATVYLGFTVFITTRKTGERRFVQLDAPSAPWLLRPWHLFRDTPDWKVAVGAFLAGLGFLALVLAAPRLGPG